MWGKWLLIGKRYFRFGVDVRIGWNPDSFGYNWQLPQIYKRSGWTTSRHPEDGMERHQPAAAQAVLVAGAGWQPGTHALSSRLRK